jgi:hypothetical protein
MLFLVKTFGGSTNFYLSIYASWSASTEAKALRHLSLSLFCAAWQNLIQGRSRVFVAESELGQKSPK